MAQKRFDARLVHTHTFWLDDLPTALRYARDRVEDAIKVAVKVRHGAAAEQAGGLKETWRPATGSPDEERDGAPDDSCHTT